MKVILASNSPRRRALLSEIFEEFEILPQNVIEKCKYTRPDLIVKSLAKIKLGNLPIEKKECLIISADTIVYKDGKIYGKPKDKSQAKEFLRELNGDKHLVYTGVAIYFNGKIYSFFDRSAVLFNRMSEEDIEEYVNGGSPMDKAGAYGIQDEEVVAAYKGSYTNIVGLPMEKLRDKLDVILKNATERV